MCKFFLISTEGERMKRNILLVLANLLICGLFSTTNFADSGFQQEVPGPHYVSFGATSIDIDVYVTGGNLTANQFIGIHNSGAAFPSWISLGSYSYHSYNNVQYFTFTFNISANSDPVSRNGGCYLQIYQNNDFYGDPCLVQFYQEGIGSISPVQTMIANAPANSVVNVPEGTFHGFVYIYNNNVTLRGAGPDKTILKGVGTNPVIQVTGSNITLENMSITDGDYQYGSAVLNVSGGVTIRNSFIYNNSAEDLNLTGYICSTIKANSVTMENVLMYDNYNEFSPEIETRFLNLNKCTILDGHYFDNQYHGAYLGYTTDPWNFTANISNCYIDYPTGVQTNTVFSNTVCEAIESDFFDPYYSSVMFPNLSVETNPMFADPDNDDYSLIWDDEGKSPLIGVEIQQDGTTTDIGAIQFEDKRLNYQFDTDDPKTENWFWVGFPVIDPIGNHDQLDGFFADFMEDDDPFTVHQFSYQTPDYADEDMTIATSENDEGNWSDNSEILKQYKGYKVQIDNGAAINNYHGVCIRNDEPVSIPFGKVETWVCYYGSESSTSPTAAFGGTLGNQLKSIHGQYWSYEKHVEIIGDSLFSQMIITWEGVANMDYYDGVQYGDMIVVETENPASFIWDEGFVSTGGGSVVTTVFNNIEADTDLNYFDYTEQADYNTFVFEFAPDDIPQEIAVYANGECIGASVVHGQDAAVFAYVTDDLYDANIDIVKWYGEREEVFSENLQVYDAEQKKYMEKDIRLSPEHQRVRISYVEHDYKEEEAPEAYSFACKNYPNPFNPTTTISYSLPEESNVCIEVYNIKGQKVKQLVNEHKESGHHTIKWNGTDENNKSVSSGVYFYKIKTKKSSLINKMIMLK